MGKRRRGSSSRSEREASGTSSSGSGTGTGSGTGSAAGGSEKRKKKRSSRDKEQRKEREGQEKHEKQEKQEKHEKHEKHEKQEKHERHKKHKKQKQKESSSENNNDGAPVLRRQLPTYRWIGPGKEHKSGSVQYSALEVSSMGGRVSTVIQLGDSVLLYSGDAEEEMESAALASSNQLEDEDLEDQDDDDDDDDDDNNDNDEDEDSTKKTRRRRRANNKDQSTSQDDASDEDNNADSDYSDSPRDRKDRTDARTTRKTRKDAKRHTKRDAASSSSSAKKDDGDANDLLQSDANAHSHEEDRYYAPHNTDENFYGVNALDPFVARVERLWEEPPPPGTPAAQEHAKRKKGDTEERKYVRDDERKMRMKIRARWYFKKEDIEGINGHFQGVTKKILLQHMGPRDLALGEQTDDNEIPTILGKCRVVRRPPLSTNHEHDEKPVPPRAYMCRYDIRIPKRGEQGFGSVVVDPYRGDGEGEDDDDELDQVAVKRSKGGTSKKRHRSRDRRRSRDDKEIQKDPEKDADADKDTQRDKDKSSKSRSSKRHKSSEKDKKEDAAPEEEQVKTGESPDQVHLEDGKKRRKDSQADVENLDTAAPATSSSSDLPSEEKKRRKKDTADTPTTNTDDGERKKKNDKDKRDKDHKRKDKHGKDKLARKETLEGEVHDEEGDGEQEEADKSQGEKVASNDGPTDADDQKAAAESTVIKKKKKKKRRDDTASVTTPASSSSAASTSAPASVEVATIPTSGPVSSTTANTAGDTALPNKSNRKPSKMDQAKSAAITADVVGSADARLSRPGKDISSTKSVHEVTDTNKEGERKDKEQLQQEKERKIQQPVVSSKPPEQQQPKSGKDGAGPVKLRPSGKDGAGPVKLRPSAVADDGEEGTPVVAGHGRRRIGDDDDDDNDDGDEVENAVGEEASEPPSESTSISTPTPSPAPEPAPSPAPPAAPRDRNADASRQKSEVAGVAGARAQEESSLQSSSSSGAPSLESSSSDGATSAGGATGSVGEAGRHTTARAAAPSSSSSASSGGSSASVSSEEDNSHGINGSHLGMEMGIDQTAEGRRRRRRRRRQRCGITGGRSERRSGGTRVIVETDSEEEEEHEYEDEEEEEQEGTSANASSSASMSPSVTASASSSVGGGPKRIGVIHVGSLHQATVPPLSSLGRSPVGRGKPPEPCWIPGRISKEALHAFLELANETLKLCVDRIFGGGYKFAPCGEPVDPLTEPAPVMSTGMLREGLLAGNAASTVSKEVRMSSVQTTSTGDNRQSTAILPGSSSVMKKPLDKKRRPILYREVNQDALLDELHRCNYNTNSTIANLRSNPTPFLTMWSEEEREQFDAGFSRYCGSLRMISRGVQSKSTTDVVDYHYRFKIPDQFRKYQEQKREQARRMMASAEGRMRETGGKSDRSGKKVRNWAKGGATEQRRLHAKDFLVLVRDTIGGDKYLQLAHFLKLYHAKTYSIAMLKESISSLLSTEPDLLERFQEFLPRQLRR